MVVVSIEAPLGVPSSVDGIIGLSVDAVNFGCGELVVPGRGLFFALKKLKGYGFSSSSIANASSGCSHAATVAPTCLAAGWFLPHTEFGDVRTLHTC